MSDVAGEFEVLLVEDDPGIREPLASILEDEGYRVTTARNGREAMAALAAGSHPTLILLDLMLPEESGWEFSTRLREDARFGEIPVVLLSGVPDLQLHAGPTGADGYLRKPINLDLFLEVVRSYCRPQQ